VFTKYNTAWMGYGRNSDDPFYLVMQYQEFVNKTGGFGLDRLHMAIAHESGHMVNAPDEYASQCRQGDKWGFSRGPNVNCENDNPAPVDCLMRNVRVAVCPSTVGHFGWADSNGDGILDPYDPTFVQP
jgi:hypothetical protein